MVSEQPNILVVDDESELRDSLCEHLERSGLTTAAAKDAASARRYLETQTPDLILLDVMMPGEDGLSLCRALRETTKIPVILLTALTDDTDKIVGLEVGADDYVTKPFNPRELTARVRAVLRRTQDPHPIPVAEAPRRFAHWQLNEQQAELVKDDGLIVSLSASELSLLLAFLDHPGTVLSRDDLIRSSRGREPVALERTVDNTIARLRKKIEPDPAAPRIIKTIRGGGYRLVVEPT